MTSELKQPIRDEEDTEGNINGDVEPYISYEDDPDTKCGLGSFRPGFLQMFASIGVFVGTYSISGLLTSTLSVYVTSQVPMLEKEFGFSSAETGLLMSMNDIGFLTCVIFTGYIAKKIHIPIGLGASMILFGICGLLCALPYFIQDNSKYDIDLKYRAAGISNLTMGSMRQRSKAPLCLNVTLEDLGQCDLTSDSDQARENVANIQIKRIAFYLIAIGMVFQGIGKSPRAPFVTLYIDDAVVKRKTGFYMGIIFSTGIFGPAIAFLLGGVFSKIYITLEPVDILPSDPRWIGAWWLGFVIFGGSAIFGSVPLMCFPRKLKTIKRRQEDAMMLEKADVIKGNNKEVASSSIVHEFKDFGKSVLRLFKNPVYIALVCSSFINLLGVAGSVAFTSKYFAAQFSIPLWKANIIMAISSITAVSIGCFGGGLITRKFKMTPLATLKMLGILYVISTCVYLCGFFIGCDQPVLYGSNNYGEVSEHYELIKPSCNANCNCDDGKYFPICGDDGRTYFSPCHAGCSESKTRTFSNCTCIPSGRAVAGLCDQGCSNKLYTYATLNFIGRLVTALKIMPGFIAQIRCVAEGDRAASTAFSGFITSALAWMPGPVIVGYLIDTTCNLWKYTCGERQSCSIYSNRDFRNTLHGFGTAAFVTATCIITGLYLYFRISGRTEWHTSKTKEQEINIIEVKVSNGKDHIYKPLNKTEDN